MQGISAQWLSGIYQKAISACGLQHDKLCMALETRWQISHTGDTSLEARDWLLTLLRELWKHYSRSDCGTICDAFSLGEGTSRSSSLDLSKCTEAAPQRGTPGSFCPIQMSFCAKWAPQTSPNKHLNWLVKCSLSHKEQSPRTGLETNQGHTGQKHQGLERGKINTSTCSNQP